MMQNMRQSIKDPDNPVTGGTYVVTEEPDALSVKQDLEDMKANEEPLKLGVTVSRAAKMEKKRKSKEMVTLQHNPNESTKVKDIRMNDWKRPEDTKKNVTETNRFEDLVAFQASSSSHPRATAMDSSSDFAAVAVDVDSYNNMQEVDVDSYDIREVDVDSFTPPDNYTAKKMANLQPVKEATNLQDTQKDEGNRASETDMRRANAIMTGSVSLPREEYVALINTVKADSLRLKALEATKLHDNNRVKALEDTVESLLTYIRNGQGPNTLSAPKLPDHTSITQSEEGEMELVELANPDDGSKPPPEDWKKKEEELQLQDDSEWHSPLGESIYTLLYLCAFKSQGFWYSIFVYCLQIATISLALADSVDLQADRNPLQLPAMVDMEVTYAQAVTIFILFAYQSDVIEGVLKLGNGFYQLEGYPGATFATWLFSCLAQLAAGLLVLLGCFILTMQAETVIDLMLNLTALLFISQIDDLGFYMAKLGFITSALEAETTAAVDVKVPKKRSSYKYRRILYFLTMAFLFIGYGTLKNWQLDGHYLFTNIYVQFGDAYNPKIPHYSGILSATKARTSAHRQYRDIDTSNILLAYCSVERAWTFSEGNTSSCDGYFAKSYETTTYDVTSIPDSEWQVMDSNGRFQPFDSFSLVERDCRPETCQGDCEPNSLCRCNNGQFGFDCEFSDVCNEIIVDDRFPNFPQIVGPSYYDPERLEPTSFSMKFQLLQNEITTEYLRVYSMPVFYSNSSFPASVMFFGGRRWILTNEQQLINLTEAKQKDPNRWYFPEKTIAVLEDDFHAHHEASYTPYFVSDPVDFETPDYHPTPIGLHWWTLENTNKTARHFTPDVRIDTILNCHDSESAPTESCVGKPEAFCGFGECNELTGLCDCWGNSYYGDRCELVTPCYEADWPCSGDGFCDQITGICKCQTPWYGDGCWLKHKCYEEEGSCENGGACNMTAGDCDCPEDPAITGAACEEVANCEVFGCANGGLCGGNGRCICQPPYYGAGCDLVNRTQEELFCFGDDDCMNGSCNPGSGFCDCENPASYGPRCEHTYNCSQHLLEGWLREEHHVPCLNDGSCNETSGVCECPEPYFGPDCSQVPPCLSDEDCAPGGGEGICDVDSGVCQCHDGRLAGLRCEKLSSMESGECKSDEDCHGSGSACYKHTCQCDHGRGGILCESLVVGLYPAYWDESQEELEERVNICGFEDPNCCKSNDTDLMAWTCHNDSYW